MSIKRFLKAFAYAVGTLATGICMVEICELLSESIKPVVLGCMGLVIAGCVLILFFYQSFDD